MADISIPAQRIARKPRRIRWSIVFDHAILITGSLVMLLPLLMLHHHLRFFDPYHHQFRCC